MVLIPAPAYSLDLAAWMPRILIWRDDGTFGLRQGEPCEGWAEAMAASLRLASQAEESSGDESPR